MNDLRKQCINMMTQKLIENSYDAGDMDQTIAHLLIFGKHYCLADKGQEELLLMAMDDFYSEFECSDEFENEDIPERTRFENWIMKQDVPNWYARG